jgi:hypothetical protein
MEVQTPERERGRERERERERERQRETTSSPRQDSMSRPQKSVRVTL